MTKTKIQIKGKTFFFIALVVIVATALSVYYGGIHAHRSVTDNFYISLSVISFIMFLFLFICLYRSFAVINNFYSFKSFKSGEIIPYKKISDLVEALGPLDFAGDDGCISVIVSALLWVLVTALLLILLIVLDFAVWFSLFILLIALYWTFIRALKTVLKHAQKTAGSLSKSILYAAIYTVLYCGWIFVTVYLAELWRHAHVN
ncbi:MAG: hypothetical protein MRY83_08425 [Flavobacteriales bacterium]|nr:hypothetical protein [Flavobacteriales bacterium]